jgi:4-diphosphocytidyl-2-C-methyl-D-erythritol kinase
MILRANCKINLGLDILRRREDGFHDLETVMLPVYDLYDEVEVVRVDGDFLFEQTGLVVDCPAEKNLCVKALRLMQERYDVGNVRIRLDKRVPFGAGLGGGSSDATAVILAVNELFGLGLSEEELVETAAMIGSDTAFFVRNTPQLCTGRGEKMESIDLPLQGLYLAVAKPHEGVSTKEAYSGVKPAVPAVRLADALKRPVNEWQGSVKNDFEPHIFAAHPEIAELKKKMLSAGALYASMSGSGSAVFGLFDEQPNLDIEKDKYLILTKL